VGPTMPQPVEQERERRSASAPPRLQVPRNCAPRYGQQRLDLLVAQANSVVMIAFRRHGQLAPQDDWKRAIEIGLRLGGLEVDQHG